MTKTLKSMAQKIRNRLHHSGLGAYEIYIESKQGMNLEVRAGQRDTCEIKSGLGFAVRVLKDQRLSYAYGSDFSDTAIDQVLKNSLDSIAFKQPDAAFGLVEDLAVTEVPDILDHKFESTSYEQKLSFLCELESLAEREHADVADIKVAALDDEREEIHIENSNGVERFLERTHYCASLGIQAERGSDQEIAYDVRTEVFFDRLNPKVMAQKAVQQAVLLLGGKSVSSWHGPVVLDAGVVGSLLEILSAAFMGDNVERSNSCLIGKLGKKLYSPVITIVDDGLRPGASGSCSFDGEGFPVASHSLIESGVVKQFLYDQYWGNRAGVASTGNCVRRDVSSQPDLSFHNLILQPGQKNLQELLKCMDRGLYIVDVIGIHNADEVSGDMAVGIQGAWVEQGEIQHAVRSMVMASNIHKIFNQVLAVGSDSQFVAGIAAPSLLVDGVQVSGQNTN